MTCADGQVQVFLKIIWTYYNVKQTHNLNAVLKLQRNKNNNIRIVWCIFCETSLLKMTENYIATY